MPSFQVNSFKFGLDTRRDVLTSLPGTLVTCENAHINPGGEIEKRKAFGDLVANTDVLDSNGATGTFGIEVTDEGIVVFGSARDYDEVYVSETGVASTAIKGSGSGATFDITAVAGAITVAAVNAGGSGYAVGDILSLITTRGSEARLTVATLSGSAVATVTITNNGNEQAEAFLVSALTAGVVYQQLKHPSLVNDSTEDYNASYHRMTSIIFSENFNGKAFACAEFTDGRRFLYYDGELIQQSANGIVMENRTGLSDLSNDLVRQLEVIGWNTVSNTDETGAAQNGSTIVKSPQGDYFTAIPSYSSSLGRVGHKLIDINGVVTSAVKAIASFQITGPSGTFTLTAPKQANATDPTVDLCGGAVAALGSAILTAEAIARAVNDLTSVHGYSAQTNTLDSVFVYAPENYDLVVPLDLTVTVTTGSVGAAGASPTSLAAIVSPSPASNTLIIVGRRVSTLVSVTVNAIVVGGTGPYTYFWQAVSGGDLVGIVSGAGTATLTVGSMLFNQSVEAVYKCVVTDSLAVSVTVYVVVRLAFYNRTL